MRVHATRSINMTGEERQMKQKGKVMIVGMKLDGTGREILTWTLAKFTHAGDRVIALHVAPSSSQADVLRSKIDAASQPADGVFDSIIGVYESFCNIKQVELQVKVTDGLSLRRALIEEAKMSNAARLILGHASCKPHIGPSFSLAKYCAKRLPTTCSVVVIQHGQVAFEKDGALGSLGDNSSGVLNTIQKTLRSHSWKSPAHHHSHVRRASMPSHLSEVDMGRDENGNEVSHWPRPSRFLDSPVSVLHAYKYPSLHMQSSKRVLSHTESPLSAVSSPSDSSTPEAHEGTYNSGSHDVRRDPSHSSLGDCFAQNEGDHHLKCVSGKGDVVEHESGKVGSAPLVQEKIAEDHTLYVNSNKPVENTDLQGDAVVNDSPPSVGWPLLHRSIPTKLNHGSVRSHRMSVVEWALQLPDRPKDTMNLQTELQDDDIPYCSPLVINEGTCHEGQRAVENSKICAADAHLQCHTDIVASRIAKLSQNCPCRQFQFVELQAATGNFNKDNMVGKGGCSQVYQGVISDGYVVAVKCLNASALDSEDDFVMEVEIMCGLRHKRIVQLIGYCVDSEHYMLVYNLASEGNLEQRLHGGKGTGVLAWESRCKIAVGVAEALKYLHDGCTRPVIHRDVKSSNILLLSDFEPQLTDFGLAKRVPAKSTQITCSDVVGTFGYLAPEYFMFGKVSEKTDVYSFGVVLLELITGRRPIDNTKSKGQENLVVWARPLLEDESSTDQLIDPKLEGLYNAGQLKNMMMAAALCLRQSPQMRPCMSRILKLLTGEVEDLEHIGRQDSACKESDDGCDMPNYGDIDIRNHLTLALFGLDDDAASQTSIEHSVNLAHSNKYLEEYLGGRYSRSSSFE
eukprot:c22906_g2_i1 orf=597-3152(+)